MSVYYIDGEFARADDASIPVSDLAVVRGYGVFDFLRTYGGKPFHLQAHLERLERSAKAIQLDLLWTREELTQIVLETLARNPYHEANIRIVLTGGSSDDFITPGSEPRLMVMVTPAKVIPDHYYETGAKVVTVADERYMPTVKSLNYIPAILALKQAQAHNALDAIYVNKNKMALEGTTTNLFAFFGDTLVTPSEGVLWGITRQVVLEMAADLYEVSARDLPLEELLKADEVFITSSNKQIMPVSTIDDSTIGRGKPGKHTQRLMALFDQVTAAHTQLTHV
jgi:branched-chain amino acid aminotransferase